MFDRISFQILMFTASACYKQGSICSHIDIVAFGLSPSNVDARNAAGFEGKGSHFANRNSLRYLMFPVLSEHFALGLSLGLKVSKNVFSNATTMKWIGYM